MIAGHINDWYGKSSFGPFNAIESLPAVPFLNPATIVPFLLHVAQLGISRSFLALLETVKQNKTVYD